MYHHEIAKMDLQELADAILQAPSYFGTSDERLFETHGFSPIGGIHRDSEALDRVNHTAILERLQEIDPESVEVGYYRHWAMGWTRPLIIRVKNEDGTLNTPILQAIQEIAAQLDGYPVLDEDALSEAENEELQESWKYWGRIDFTDQLEKLLYDSEESIPDEPREQALEAFLDAINDAGGSDEIWGNSYTGEPSFNEKAFNKAEEAIWKTIRQPAHSWLLEPIQPHHTSTKNIKNLQALKDKLKLQRAAQHPTQTTIPGA